MSTLTVAQRHARQRVALARRAAREAARLWRQVDRSRIALDWMAALSSTTAAVATAQALAAALADPYVDALLGSYGLPLESTGSVQAAALAGIASDGRELRTLLYQPAITALTEIKGGASPAGAMNAGRFVLDMITRTQVADAGRAADSVALATRPRLDGYVRLPVGGTCSRCLILAGKWYRWNAGFQRHPRCDCTSIPAMEDVAGDLRTDPRAAFTAMPAAEQDRVFTASGAQAIRDGADMNQVVNARRGVATASVYGRDLVVTTEGRTVYGLAGKRLGAAKTPRLMPESIYRIADGNRDEALRLLRRFGYII